MRTRRIRGSHNRDDEDLSFSGVGRHVDLNIGIDFFNVLLTVHLSIILDKDQLDTHLLYFTIRLL